jgi:hypothetical protein
MFTESITKSKNINPNLYIKFEGISNPESVEGYKDFFPLSNYYCCIKNPVEHIKSLKNFLRNTSPTILNYFEFNYCFSLEPLVLKQLKNGSMTGSITIIHGNKINNKNQPITTIVLTGCSIKFSETKFINNKHISHLIITSNDLLWTGNIIDMEEQTSQGKIIGHVNNIKGD